MPASPPPPSHVKPSLLTRAGLGRRDLRAWALYDWANSAFATTIMAAVLPIYYHQVAGAGLAENMRTVYWGYTQTVALVVVAVLSPVLGAAADYLGAKKRFLATFAAMGIAGTALLYFGGEGEWKFVSLAFIVANIGFASADVFYESLLPHIAEPEEVDRVSTAGYALGYIGGGLLLSAQMACILMPERFGLADAGQASRLAFLSVAVWWAMFSVPVLRVVAEPPRRLDPGESLRMSVVKTTFSRLARTFADIRRYREAFFFLLAFWLYNDGIITIVKMATIYGTEIGIGQGHLIGAILVVQFLGIPATFGFGWLAGRIGAQRSIYLALGVYTGISVLGYFMTQAWEFWLLACAVGTVQGGAQALSRSLFSTLIPRNKSSEFFGFFNISGRFGNIFGPLVFAAVSQWTGGSRLSILALIAFFLGGLALLTRVNVAEGRRLAAEETLRARVAAQGAD